MSDLHTVLSHIAEYPGPDEPAEPSGYRIRFACGSNTLLPMEILEREVIKKMHQATCPGCGAPAEIISLTYRSRTDPYAAASEPSSSSTRSNASGLVSEPG